MNDRLFSSRYAPDPVPNEVPAETRTRLDYKAFRLGLLDEKNQRELAFSIHCETGQLIILAYSYISSMTIDRESGLDVLTIFSSDRVVRLFGQNLASAVNDLRQHLITEMHVYDEKKFATPPQGEAIIIKIQSLQPGDLVNE